MARTSTGRIWLPQVAASGLLLWALNPENPYGYYIFLRFVCCGVFAYLAVIAYDHEKRGWVWLLGAKAVLYNPLIRVHLDRETWSFINVATIAVAIASVFASRKAPGARARIAGLGTQGSHPTGAIRTRPLSTAREVHALAVPPDRGQSCDEVPKAKAWPSGTPVPSRHSDAAPLVALLDDESCFLELVESVLVDGYGLRVVTFTLKNEFLASILNTPTSAPDVIVSDLISGVMTGSDFLRVIKAHPTFRHIPVVILSGQVPDSAIDVFQLGAHACLSKPVSVADLARVIWGALRERDRARARVLGG